MTREELITKRKRMRLTQAELATALGMGRRRIVQFEARDPARRAPIPRVVELAIAELERQHAGRDARVEP